MATNKPIFYRSVTAILDRAAEIGATGDQFVNGCNRGVASGALGINTGDYNPKASDFSRDEPRYAEPASYIGQLVEAVANDEAQMWGLPDTDDQETASAGVVGFDYATADTVAAADYGSSLVLTNYTDGEIPTDGWAWGFEAAGGAPVAPIADAGGPYEGVTVALDGTGSVFGTDPSPTIEWTVFSNATGNILNADTLTPTWDWNGDPITNPITLLLTITPNDGPPVTDTATLIVPI